MSVFTDALGSMAHVPVKWHWAKSFRRSAEPLPMQYGFQVDAFSQYNLRFISFQNPAINVIFVHEDILTSDLAYGIGQWKREWL
ncbi:hypothetical protein [Sedimentitalea nanhaiensis]|uniref:hypothetical protein n=1 Tax=Sedimentitalea nanhaiensis TaxID=999627 RepID=UPI001113D366|nr:hypothetical protein [Sedimentitalea nanhaiensis]